MPGGLCETYGTLGTSGAAVTGTLIAGGLGTSLYINECSMNVVSGTVDCAIGWGTGLASIGSANLVRGQYAAGGAIQKTFKESPYANNTSLTYRLGGAGTVHFNVTYEQTARA